MRLYFTTTDKPLATLCAIKWLLSSLGSCIVLHHYEIYIYVVGFLIRLHLTTILMNFLPIFVQLYAFSPVWDIALCDNILHKIDNSFVGFLRRLHLNTTDKPKWTYLLWINLLLHFAQLYDFSPVRKLTLCDNILQAIANCCAFSHEASFYPNWLASCRTLGNCTVSLQYGILHCGATFCMKLTFLLCFFSEASFYLHFNQWHKTTFV